ncbi:MAG: AAA family ATPase [Candidatus Woesearchaeota archaeon]
MTIVTKLRLHGFKSFAKKTDLVFGDKFNLILGSNGSGKSNLLDSLCFVLGKTSAKSLRAEKSANLIYNGGKLGKPANSAEVSIFFDNSEKKFPIDSKEVKVSRIVNKKGQSIYKVNDKKMNRQQVVDLLSTSNIDPDGHNIILQGDIVQFATMKPMDRRILVEEIAGISVFEDKKVKAMGELDRVEERLREAHIMLAEREAHLRELKKERDHAKKYKELQEKIKDNKATYNHLRRKAKEISLANYDKDIADSENKLNKSNSKIEELTKSVSELKNEINRINSDLDLKGEKEQMDLRQGILAGKSDVVRARARMEIIHSEIKKIEERCKQLKDSINENHAKLDALFAERKKLVLRVNKLEKDDKRLEEKADSGNKSDSFDKKVNDLTRLRSMSSGQFSDASIDKVSNIPGVHGTISELGNVDDRFSMAMEVCAGARIKSVITTDELVAKECIEILKKNRLGVLTFLPLNKIKPRGLDAGTKDLVKESGVHGVALDLVKFDKNFLNAFSNIFGSTLIVDNIDTARRIGIGRARMVTLDGDLVETSGAMIGGYRRRNSIGFKQVGNVEKRILSLEREIDGMRSGKSPIDNERQNIMGEIMEFNADIRTLDSKTEMIGDENEKIEKIIKDHEREKREFLEETEDLKKVVRLKEGMLKDSEGKEKRFYTDIKTLAANRNKLEQDAEKRAGFIVIENDNSRKIENKVNELRIYRAQVVAELEGLKVEAEEFKDGKIRKSVDVAILKKEIDDFEKLVARLGNVNMRALEVYDQLAENYRELLEKVNKLRSEKEDVMNLIAEIAEKKTTVFMETYKHLNSRFKEIFNNLSTKGLASLDLENKETPLDGGLDINVQIAKGKYLDIRSLSGGEKTLAALAFIFAIQEYNPASFYILDEVDAALDKHNSEKLGKLFAKYASNAQYIVISHNDYIINEADILYGVSMQDGISKVTSLRI